MIALDEREIDRGDVHGLADAYRALHGAPAGHALQPSARVHGVTFGQPPAVAGDLWAMHVGRVYGRGGPVRAEARDLDGQFALIRGDREGRVEVLSDPLAMQALYVAATPERLYVSTSALALARHLRRPLDPLGARSFLRTGTLFGELTAFDGVRRVDPATILRVGPGGLERSTYWSPALDPAVRRLSLESTVKHCLEALVETGRERLGGREGLWADLTGGFDSRLLCLALSAGDVAFSTTTRGSSDAPDVRIAREIAELRRWDWTHHPPLDGQGAAVAELLMPAAAWGNGALDALQLTEVLWMQRENGRRGRSLVSGGGGEHLRHYASSHELLRLGRTTKFNLERFVDLRLVGPEDTSVFAQDPTAEVRDDALRRLRERAAPFSGEVNTFQLDVLYAYKSMGHFGAYCSAGQAYLEPELPFYWRPVLTAALSARDRYRTQRILTRHMIAALDPRVAALPTERGGPAEPWRVGNVHRFAPYYARLGRNVALRTVRRRLNPGASNPGSASRVVPTRVALAAHLRDRGVLTPATMRTAAFYRPQALDRLVDAALRPGFGGWSQLGRIATLELVARATESDGG
ncbi:MAG: hypothetical protein QOE86_2564 [Solirubrobacteraceae bacterium]|nr:hypothetical protein [Solirubrobacteraceae bacterium]